MKILIFGGSFNPFHNGHLHLFRVLRDLVKPDKTLVIPTYIPVHKAVGGDFLAPEHRLEMCRLAFDDADVEVSDLEISQSKPCYSFDTLNKIREMYPDAELFLACGTDMFLTFDQWYRYRDIYQLAIICAVARDDSLDKMKAFAKEQEKLGMKYLLSQAEPYVISSSDIRDMLRRGEDASAHLPNAVTEYICQNGLYR